MPNETKAIDYSVMLADLYAKRAGIDAAIAGIMAASGGNVSVPEGAAFAAMGSVTGGDRQATELPRGAFLGKSLPAAVKLYLSAVMKKQTIKEIATALHDGGMETNSDNFENVITGCLNRMKNNGEILRFKDGWALAEFYPEHLRRSLATGTAAKSKNVKKTKKARKVAKPATKPQPAAPRETLEKRIEAFAWKNMGGIVNFKQIVEVFPGTKPAIASMNLAKIAKKFGWNKTVDGGYHVQGKIQEIQKAV
jgi:hypothetical protein